MTLECRPQLRRRFSKLAEAGSSGQFQYLDRATYAPLIETIFDFHNSQPELFNIPQKEFCPRFHGLMNGKNNRNGKGFPAR